MSHLILKVSKFARNDIEKIQNHIQSGEGVGFVKRRKTNYLDIIDSRITKLPLKKKVRKDAILMCQCYVSTDKSFFENKVEFETERFFFNCANFLHDRFGKENTISANMHKHDVPHLHFCFVPVIENKLCAKDLLKRSDLLQLHSEFYNYLHTKGYELILNKKLDHEAEQFIKKSDLKKIISRDDLFVTDLKKIKLQPRKNKLTDEFFYQMSEEDFIKLREEIICYRAIINSINELLN